MPELHGHVWVPIDDEHTWTFNWIYAYDPSDPARPRARDRARDRTPGRGPDDYIPGTFRLKRNAANDYLIDRAGAEDEDLHRDQGHQHAGLWRCRKGWARSVDRTQGASRHLDRAIIAARQLLLEALRVMEAGGTPRAVDTETYRNVRAVDLLIPKSERWQDYLKGELVAKF